jgi:hypothetical protein
MSAIGTQKLQAFRQPISKPAKIGPEFNPWFWNPNRIGADRAPSYFLHRLWNEMGTELRVTWNPINERWQVWTLAPTVNHPICQGWKLLFIHNGPSGEYLPLDERVFARLYASSARVHGSGKEYFNRIVSEMERDKERREANYRQDTIDLAMPSWEHSQIKVGYGPSNGSKFSTYHS